MTLSSKKHIEQFQLGVSTAGNRTHNMNANDTHQRATDRMLRAVEEKSVFFDTMEPYKLPSFESSGRYSTIVLDVAFADAVGTTRIFLDRGDSRRPIHRIRLELFLSMA